jgi:hypothetical protein
VVRFSENEANARALTYCGLTLLVVGALALPFSRGITAVCAVGILGIEFLCESWRPRDVRLIAGALALLLVVLVLALTLNIN